MIVLLVAMVILVLLFHVIMQCASAGIIGNTWLDQLLIARRKAIAFLDGRVVHAGVQSTNLYRPLL